MGVPAHHFTTAKVKARLERQRAKIAAQNAEIQILKRSARAADRQRAALEDEIRALRDRVAKHDCEIDRLNAKVWTERTARREAEARNGSTNRGERAA